MIRLELLSVKDRSVEQIDLDELDGLIKQPDSLVWIDLENPAPDDFALLAREFNFHPLALEDARMRGQRPKLDEYADFFFIVFYCAEVVDDARGFDTEEIALFVGANYLVTVHMRPCHAIETTARRWKEDAGTLKGKGVVVLLYSLLDTIVDGYFPILDEVAERVDELEESIFGQSNGRELESLFQLRKNLLSMRRVLAPERDLVGMLLRKDVELLGPSAAVYFQDVYDHLLRVTDSLDTYRDLLAGALDAHLSVISNNLNQVMRTLTSWSIILMSLAIIPAIYGMNVRLSPAAGSRLGWDVSLGLMALLAAALFALFRGIDWL